AAHPGPPGARPRPRLRPGRRGAEPVHRPAAPGGAGGQGQRAGALLGDRPGRPAGPAGRPGLQVLPEHRGARARTPLGVPRAGRGPGRRGPPGPRPPGGRAPGGPLRALFFPLPSRPPDRRSERAMNLDFGITDLSGTFSVLDVTVALSLAFVLSTVTAWVYRRTHRNVSYSQTCVQTLIVLGMSITLIMFVSRSHSWQASSLVLLLSVLLFFLPIDSPSNVSFSFSAISFGLPCHSQLYSRSGIALPLGCSVILFTHRLTGCALNVPRHR